MRFLRVSTGCLALTFLAFAQSDRGTITGAVSDPANAVVPGATVVARNTETGTLYETVTTSTGNYTLPALQVGIYELSVSVAGFSKAVQTGVRVQVAQTVRVDVALQVGATTESISVNAAAPLLKTESAEQSTTIARETINSLPLNFSQTQGGAIRNPLAFATLTPGAYFAPGSQNTIKVNGSPTTSFKIVIEGQDATNGLTQSTTNHNQPSVESIQEFTLQTSNFAAEYGQVAGGLFNFSVRSGTNQYHGALYEYLTNEALNAGQPFTDNGKGGLVRSPNKKHDFGGTIGGPVWLPKLYDGHNKTFFFFSAETYYDTKIQSGLLNTVPTLKMREGDFSEILTTRQLNTDPLGRGILENTIYNPLSARPIASGAVVSDPFPSNVIPQSQLDPVALKIQALLPKPTRSGTVNNWDQSIPNPRTQIIRTVKADHNFSSSSKVSFYWHYYTSHEYSGADGLPAPITAVRDKYVYSHTFRLNYDHTVTPTLLLHVGLGDQRFHNPDTSPPSVLQDFNAVKELGLVGGAANGFPRLAGMSNAFGGMFNIGPTNANRYYTDKPTVVLNATKISGSHTFKAGGEWKIDAFTDRNERQSSGVYNFGATETALPSTNGQALGGGVVGFPYASFLLGRVNNASVNAPQDPQYRKMSISFFAQDNWKITRKITLDYGLRWDRQGQGHELHYRSSSFDPRVKNPSAGGLLGGQAYEGYGPGRCDCNFAQTYNYAFGPRLGIAYQINPKTVLRAGWGISYGGTGSYNYITNAAILGIGFNQFAWVAPAFGDPAILLRNGLPYNQADLYKVTLDPGVRPSPGMTDSPPYWIDPNAGRPPRINQWSIGLQRELTKDLVVEAAYVGNRGAWLQANSMVDLNALTPQRLKVFGLDINSAADRSLLTSRLNSTTAQARGFSAPYAGFPTTLPVAQSLRPFPQFTNIPARWAPLGNNWYDSLQVKATKRYSRGLDFTAAFTWQKELILGGETETGGGAATVNDVFNRRNQKTYSPSSQPYVFVTAFNYQVPAWGPNRLVRAVVRDWSVGGLLRYASGLPIQVPGAQNNLNSVLFRSTYANRVPGQPLFTKDLNCHCIDPNKDFVLNPAAWSEPAQGQWGFSAPYYNDYRQQRRYDEQLSLGRIFRIRERMNFHIRAEFFNVFNRTYLDNPTSGNALQAQQKNNQGVPTQGFGRINPATLNSPPRNGQIVARFQW